MAKFAFYCDYDARVTNDKLFQVESKDVYAELAKELTGEGHEIHTLDIYQRNNINPDICVFLDVPRDYIRKIIDPKKTFATVIVREGKVILPINYNEERLSQFGKILTWDAELLNKSNAVYFPSARFILEDKVIPVDFDCRKFCCNISRKLTSVEVGELYSERLKAIEWFENHHPEKFDLYGYGWNQGVIKLFGKTIHRSNIFYKRRPSYRGALVDKYGTLRKYKFSICFENTSSMKNYLSEKIFDCFLAQTIPIYYGATNIRDLVPTECFIDFREFENYEELYFYLSSMPKKKFMTYLDAINNFIDSPEANYFRFESWVSIVKRELIKLVVLD